MERIILRYGLMMFAGFTGFFLLMHVLGLTQHYHLRLLNGVIHFTFLTLAIKAYHQREGAQRTYMSDVATGVAASLIGVGGFSVFQMIFLSASPDFMQYLQTSIPNIGEHLTPFTASLTIFMEGLAASVIGSYIITRIIDSMSRDSEFMKAKRLTIAERKAEQQ